MTAEDYIKEVDAKVIAPMRKMLEQSIEREERWHEMAERANAAERDAVAKLRTSQIDETRRRFRASLMMEWIQKDSVPISLFHSNGELLTKEIEYLDAAERWADAVLERCFTKSHWNPKEL